MATMTMTAKPIIKTAMNKIGLDDKTDDLLEMMDKIELDMNLAISLEQAANGMKRPAREVLEEIRKEVLGAKTR